VLIALVCAPVAHARNDARGRRHGASDASGAPDEGTYEGRINYMEMREK
jgi:hypothetical protein